MSRYGTSAHRTGLDPSLAARKAHAAKKKRKSLEIQATATLSRLNDVKRRIIDHSMSTGMTVHQAAKAVFPPEEWSKANLNAREIERDAPVMKFMYEGQQLKLIPALVMMAKSNMALLAVLDDPKATHTEKTRAAQVVHSSMKESGALTRYSDLIKSDREDAEKTNEELARTFLRERLPEPPKQIEAAHAEQD